MSKTGSWFDDETLWRELHPFMFPPERFAQAATEIGKMLKLARPAGRAALDLGCGPGRCSLALARRGFRVTGVDKTAFLLNKARRNARQEGRAIEFVKADMRDFVRPDAFHLAISMYTTFGYFDEPADDLKVLRNVLASLKPGGRIFMEMMGKEVITRNYMKTIVEDHPDGAVLVQRNTPYDAWRRNRCEWLLIRGDRVKRYAFTLRLFSGGELADLLERAGFVKVRLFGSFDGVEYGLAAQRLIAVAEKAA